MLKNQHMKEVKMFAPKSWLTAQNSTMPFITYNKAAPSRIRTRMTRIARIFTDTLASVSCEQSVFHRIPSAFIMPKPRGFSTLRTLMPAGISGHALQSRDSGRHLLQLIFVSLRERTQALQFKLFSIINEYLNIKPHSAQRTHSRIENLCALCVLCGGLTLFTTKNNSKGELKF